MFDCYCLLEVTCPHCHKTEAVNISNEAPFKYKCPHCRRKTKITPNKSIPKAFEAIVDIFAEGIPLFISTHMVRTLLPKDLKDKFKEVQADEEGNLCFTFDGFEFILVFG